MLRKEEWPDKDVVWLSRVTEYLPLTSETKPVRDTVGPTEMESNQTPMDDGIIAYPGR
jgi:hypothetical protein